MGVKEEYLKKYGVRGQYLNKYYNGLDVDSVDQAYIDSYIKDSNDFFSSVESEYGGLGYGTARSAYDARNATWQDLEKRNKTIEGWLAVNRDYLDKDSYNALSEALKAYNESGASVLSNFKNASDFYSQFATEDDYKQYEWYQTLANSPEASLGWEKYLQDHNKETSERKPRDRYRIGSAGFFDLGRYENVKENVYTEPNYRGNWSDEEKRIFGALYNSSPDDAYKYAQSINEGKAVQSLLQYDNSFGELALSSIAGVEQFVSGIEGVVHAIAGTEGSTSPLQTANSIMSENNKNSWKVANDLTKTITNMLPTMAMGPAGVYVLGASAGGNAYKELLRTKDYTVNQARVYGTLSGVVAAGLQRALGGISAYAGNSEGFFQAIAGKITPNISKVFSRFSVEYLGKMLDEGLEESIEEILDPVIKLIATGEADDVKIQDVLYSGLLGFLSAGAFEGIKTYKDVTAQNGKEIDYGSAIMNRDGGSENIAELMSLAEEMYAKNNSAELSAYMKSVAKNPNAGNVGRLAIEMESEIASQKKGDLTNALMESGLTKREAKSAAGYITGEDIKNSKVKKIENNERIAEIVDSVANDKDLAIKANETQEKYLNALADKASKGNFKVAQGDERSRLKGNVSIKEIASIKDGKMVLRLSDGSKVNADSMTFSTEQAKLYAAALDMGLNAESANVFVNGFNGKKNIDDYVLGFKEAYQYGKKDIPADMMSQRGFAAQLTADERSLAYNLGKTDAKYEQSKKEGTTNEQEGVHLRDGGERTRSENTEGEVRSVEDRAGENQSRKIESRPKDRKASNLPYNREVSIKDLGVEGGFTTKKVKVVADGAETLSMKNAREKAEKRGLKITFFTGGNLFFTEGNHNVEARAYIKGDQILVRADHPLYDAEQLVEHEIGHDMINKGEIDLDEVRARIIDSYGEENVKVIADAYTEAYMGSGLNADQIWEEVVCDSLGGINVLANHETLSEKFGEINGDFLAKLKDEALGGTKAERAPPKTEFSSPEEAKMSGKVSDSKFSREFAPQIAENQRKYVRDGLSVLSEAEVNKAIEQTAHMVDVMKPYDNILPQDKVGKTLVKNGSYDVSVENTTVCIRTLAYNSFVDMVSEKIGRPLTQMESFLVSQKLYEIAKEPQCLYCYVSLDRKAYNEMVIRYVNQRDAAIEAYKAAGKPKIPSSFSPEFPLFKEFLNDGRSQRKPTQNMWDRYTSWITAYNKGEHLVGLNELATEANRIEALDKGGTVAEQVKDILKYAQSASWAKKQTQYVAYFDEILKLKPTVIRNLNKHYGMRWYSFSDYSGAFIVENMQQITDAAIRGLKGLSYTKDTDFAEIFAPTGMNINISVYAKKTETGYEIDEKQSANIKEAIKLREQYPNVGIVVVATDKGGVEWALAQEWSDVVIPFHTVRTGADVAEFYNWEIFNSEQNDSVADQNLWDEYVKGAGKKKVSKMVYPSEHQNDRAKYLAICEERGLTPRFKSFLDNPNYMKLVNETRQSEGETSPLKAIFDLDAAERSFDKFVEKGGYYEGWYNDGIDVDGEAEIVASDVLAGKKANEVSYGRQDTNFENLLKRRKENRAHGHASRELGVDTELDEEYNIDIYTSSDDFYRTVSYADQSMFVEKLSKLTSMIRGGETRTINIYCLDKVYSFVANGHMRGFIATSEKVSVVEKQKRRLEKLYGRKVYPVGEIVSIWSQSVSNQYGRQVDNSGTSRQRGGTTNDGSLSANEPTGSRKGHNERIRENTHSKEEVDELIKKLREIHVDSHTSRELPGETIVEPTEKKLTNRAILANALESAAKTDAEKARLAEYKKKADEAYNLEVHLAEINAEIREISFTEGSDRSKIAELREEKTKTENRLKTYDGILLRLEATKSLKELLEREKKVAYRKAVEEGREALSMYRLRSRTSETRREIKKVAKRLDSLLNRGTKEKNVKKGLHGAIASTLDLVDLLFSDTVKNEDIVRNGVDNPSEREADLLTKYRKELENRDNIMSQIEELYEAQTDDTTHVKIEKLRVELEKIRGKISTYDGKLAELFERERTRLNRATSDNLFDDLIREYSALAESKDSYIKNAYSSEVETRLKALKTSTGGKLVRDMNELQLVEFLDAMKMMEKLVSESNNIFRDGKKEDLGKRVTDTQSEMFDPGEKKDLPSFPATLLSGLNAFSWNNLRPVDAFERVGSKAFTDMYWDIVNAMGVAARDVQEAGEVIASARRKHGYAKWNLKVADKTFKTRDGIDFRPSLADKLSIYAYSKRQSADGKNQAMAHMVDGGFVFDTGSTYKVQENGKTYVRRKMSQTYRLDEMNIAEIIASLTPEQKAYVDDIVKLLTDMGAKGNEVSNILYGIDLFKEKVYFPLQSSSDFINSTQTELGAAKTASSLANMGITKPTVPGAKNPIVLKAFDDVVFDHIEKMSNYHALVIPIENLRKVFDNVSFDTAGMPITTKELIGSRFGKEAQDYFAQWLTDLNGGISPQGAKSPLAQMFSRAKGTAVAANLSVVSQQYSSIIRAMEDINPKYFVPLMNKEARKSDGKAYEELLKYAPIALVKEMGGFDVGSRGRVKDYIGYNEARKDAKYVKKKVDDIAMWGATKMDELGWVTIWKAVKAEVAAEQKLKVGTDAFYKACEKRFTEVVTKTQVYDSVASRSGYMRSKSDLVKFSTSFMGEPTVIAGRYLMSGINLARAIKAKDSKAIKRESAHFMRMASVVAASTALAKLAQALVYAGRDDEEDKALMEKWARSYANAIAEDFKWYSAANYVPFGRDVVSIIEGWSVDRPDMSLLEDIVRSTKKVTDGDLTLEDALGMVGSAGNFLGIPAKNVIREIKSGINVIRDLTDEYHAEDIVGAWQEGWVGDSKSDGQQLYEAMIDGDTKKIERVEGRFKSDTAIGTAIRKALRDNDPRIAQGAQALYNGEYDDYETIVDAIVSDGVFDREDVIKAIRAEANAMSKDEDEETEDTDSTTDKDEAVSYYSSSDVITALEAGKYGDAKDAIDDIVATKVKNGATEKQAKAAVKSSLTTHWKPLYKEAYKRGDTEEMKRIRYILLNSGLYGRSNEVVTTVQAWIKE